MATKPTKSEVVPGLLLASTRYSEVLVLKAPTSRGMVLCEALDIAGNPREVLLPIQVLRWQ